MKRTTPIERQTHMLAMMEAIHQRLDRVRSASFNCYRAWLQVGIAIEDLKLEIAQARNPHDDEPQ